MASGSSVNDSGFDIVFGICFMSQPSLNILSNVGKFSWTGIAIKYIQGTVCISLETVMELKLQT